MTNSSETQDRPALVDTALLAAHGYRHGGSTVLDLFPHTPHVEVVTRFDR